MQIIYLVTFALILISLSTFGLQADNEAAVFEARAMAGQMAMYHRASMDKCLVVTCASGPVDPTGYLHPQIAAGSLRNRGIFITTYDAATKTIMTHMKSGYNLRGSVTFGTVSSALRDLQTPDTSSVGKWDAAAGRVIATYSRSFQAVYPIPAAMRNGVPDGSPIFVNRL